MDVRDALTQAGWRVSPFAYRLLCASVSLVVGVSAAFFFGHAGAALLGVALFVVLMRVPAVFARKKAEDLEAELATVLRLVAVQLPFAGFETAVQNAVELGVPRPHPALCAWAKAVGIGENVAASLQRLSRHSSSLWVKKAAMQVFFAYRQGRGETLWAVADELAARHAEKQRGFAAKTVFLSAWFVVLGSLVPMMLAAYVLVGSAFLSFSFSPELVWAGFALGLPLLLGLVVVYAFLVSPGGWHG